MLRPFNSICWGRGMGRGRLMYLFRRPHRPPPLIIHLILLYHIIPIVAYKPPSLGSVRLTLPPAIPSFLPLHDFARHHSAGKIGTELLVLMT